MGSDLERLLQNHHPMLDSSVVVLIWATTPSDASSVLTARSAASHLTPGLSGSRNEPPQSFNSHSAVWPAADI